MTAPNIDSSYRSSLSASLTAMGKSEKQVVELAKPGPISSSRMVHLIENERMFAIGAQVVREADGIVGMVLNVKR